MAYIDQFLPHAGSAEVLFSGMYDEPAGTIARTVPRWLCTDATMGTTAGTVYVRGIALPAGMVVSNIAVLSGSTAAVAPTHLWFGLTDVQLNVLGVTADQGAAAIGAATLFKLGLGGPVVIPQTGLYYVVVSVSATTTQPTLARAPAIASGIVGTAPVIAGTAGTLATPPAVGTQINTGTITSSGAVNYGAWLS